MKYYKFIDDDGNVTYQSHTKEVNHPKMQEIMENEYIAILEELKTNAEVEVETEEQSKDERIAELEEENASLLYQILTGEELNNV